MSRSRNIADLGGQSLATDAEVASAVASKASYVYSSTAPSSPSNGFLWMDTSTASPKGKVWNGSEWKLFSGAGAANFSNTATGTYTSGGENYKYVQFNGSGTLTVTQDGFADILVVGGGAGAGGYYSSGAGAGGFAQEVVNVPLVVGNYAVTVGAGGAYTGNNGGDGNNSQISGTGVLIKSGTCSGGGSYNAAVGGGTCTGGEGHASANYPPACYGGRGFPSGGGGGGAGGNATSKTGGIGIYSSITGTSVGYGGGGGAGTNGGSGTPSVGYGGGAGGNQNGGPNLAPTAGTANRGGGGGSKGWGDSFVSQPGGSGVVIVRVKV